MHTQKLGVYTWPGLHALVTNILNIPSFRRHFDAVIESWPFVEFVAIAANSDNFRVYSGTLL